MHPPAYTLNISNNTLMTSISKSLLDWLLVSAFLIISCNIQAQENKLKTETFKVAGACEHCKQRIENAANMLRITQANWTIETKSLTIRFDSTQLSIAQIQKKLASLGHTTNLFKADEHAYSHLPPCCQYARNEAASTETADTTIVQKKYLIKGIVLEEDKKGKLLPLPGAVIRDLNTNQLSATDSLGTFKITCSLPAHIRISYTGFEPDTLTITSAEEIKVILKNASHTHLQQVVVTSKRFSTYISSLSTLNTLHMGAKELTKAACCNLSESFETNPSIDVNYTDGVTGIRQIQMLGLSGIYTQITTENIPEIRGLPGSYGLTFIPGPWIESVQVTKGTGSVANGYESITGQINIEEKKPDTAEKLLINGYANNLSRIESNVNVTHQFNNYWSTGILTHASGVSAKIDNNNDGFLDIPIGRQLNIINRWEYTNPNGLEAQIALKALSDNRQAGQNDFDPAQDKLTNTHYGLGIELQQYQLSSKIGYVFPQEKYKSLGLILSAISYNNQSYYGLNTYDATQRSLYANLIYQSIIGTTAHKIRTGFSLIHDTYNETFATTNFHRKETVPGTFLEYTFTPTDKFTAIAGLRIDYHNQYHFITTPRLNLKYDIAHETQVRFSAGSGFRTANIFAENIGLFVSSRQYEISGPTLSYAYGLNPEKAWNYGLNLTHRFELKGRTGSLSIDAYRTVFTNQTVVDVDTDAQKVLFYDLKGQSYSNSIQAELNYEILNKLDIRLAYRWMNVATNYNGLLLAKPLVAKNRAFINVGYTTKNNWKFDFTTQWFDKKRLPNASEKYSPMYLQLMAQITKELNKKYDVYIGSENLTNYTQQDIIISADQPFSPNFDASMVWGPANGRLLYIGFRYKIKTN